MKRYHAFCLVILMFSCERESKMVCMDNENVKKPHDLPVPVKAGLRGVWKLVDIDYSEYYSSLSEETRLQMQPEIESQMKNMIGKTTYDFGQNNCFTIQIPSDFGETSILGKYQISKNSDSIYFLFDEEQEVYRVDVMTKKQMILKTSEAPNRRLIFSK